jgi:Fe-S-cluster containining protein
VKKTVNILDAVMVERQQCSNMMRAVMPRREEAGGREIACTSGCAWCCHVKLITDVLDGLVAYRYLVTQGRWNRGMRLALLKADAELNRFTHAECLRMLLPCVFLDHGVSQASVTGKCSIYPARPLSCSVTFAFTPGRELCGRVGGHASFQAVPNTPDQYALTRRAIREYELKPDYYTLPGAVLVAEAIAENRSRPDLVHFDFSQRTERPQAVDELFDAVVLKQRGNIEAG